MRASWTCSGCSAATPTAPDIARQLFVSVNTVRTHTKNVYAELGVTNRRAAVRRGEQLDLLSRARAKPGRAVISDQ